jgi:hypothetical protein
VDGYYGGYYNYPAYYADEERTAAQPSPSNGKTKFLNHFLRRHKAKPDILNLAEKEGKT